MPLLSRHHSTGEHQTGMVYGLEHVFVNGAIILTKRAMHPLAEAVEYSGIYPVTTIVPFM